jgi:hypothetical protein
MTSVIEVSPAKPVVRTSRAVQELERFIFPVLLIAGWEVFARSGFLPPALLPAPSAVLHALGDWVFGFDETTRTYSGHWTRDAFASALRVFGGFALASVMGILAGVAIGWSRLFEKTLEPIRMWGMMEWTLDVRIIAGVLILATLVLVIVMDRLTGLTKRMAHEISNFTTFHDSEIGLDL